MLLPMKELLIDAKERKYGIAAANVFNKESIAACFEAADELKAPIILNVHRTMDMETALFITKYYQSLYQNVKFATNVDHGESFDEIIVGIRHGVSSVMCDRSTLPLSENIKEVAEIVKVAHAIGLSVEAELGHVGQGFEYEKTRDSGLTRPEEAKEFIDSTDIDCLAVAVGTSHGVYKGEPHLEFELLEKLAKELPIPLVLHGGSGTGDDNLEKAVTIGIQKVNLFTDLSQAGSKAVKNLLETNPNASSLDIEAALKEGYKQKLKHYMILFHSDGKAV